MATYLDVFTIEPNVAAGLASIVATATGLTTYSAFDEGDKSTPRAEVIVELGAHTQHFGNDGLGSLVPDAWEAQVVVRIYTDRSKSAQSAAQSINRAKVRLAMQPFRGLFTETVLPYHQIPYLWEQGTTESVSEEEDVDMSELFFSGEIHIRPDVLATVMA